MPPLGPLADGCPAAGVVGAPVELLAAAARPSAAVQTFAARAAMICARVGTPPSTTTIVTRWTIRPERVRAVIR